MKTNHEYFKKVFKQSKLEFFVVKQKEEIASYKELKMKVPDNGFVEIFMQDDYVALNGFLDVEDINDVIRFLKKALSEIKRGEL
jgi:uncharacterized protein YpbB